MKKLPLFSLAAMLASTSAFADTYFIKSLDSTSVDINDISNWNYTATDIYPDTEWVEAPFLDSSTKTGYVKTSSTIDFSYSDATSAPTSENNIAYVSTKIDGSSAKLPSSFYVTDGVNANNFIIRTNRNLSCTFSSSDTGTNFVFNVAGTFSILYTANTTFTIDDEDYSNTYTIKAGSLSLIKGDSTTFGSSTRAFDCIDITNGTTKSWGSGGTNSTPIVRFYSKQVSFGGTYSMGYNNGKGITTTTEMYFTDLKANTEKAAFNVGGEIVLDQVDDNAETTDVNEYVQDIFILDFSNAGLTDDSTGTYNLVYAKEGYSGFDLWDENLVYGFKIQNLNLTEGNYEFIMNDNMLQLAVGSAVPEPATVAGIAGLLALAFAAYRRRK